MIIETDIKPSLKRTIKHVEPGDVIRVIETGQYFIRNKPETLDSLPQFTSLHDGSLMYFSNNFTEFQLVRGKFVIESLEL